jgi:superfamily II DNA or RNA helicase
MASYATTAKETIYGRKFLVVALDEAHDYKNIRKGYWAAFSLRERSDSVIAMTATPCTEHPMVSASSWLSLT